MASKSTITLTNQQKEIVDCECSFLTIKAFAGTGKTTTLVEFAKKRPEETFLYLAFNKSVANSAKNIFPKNVQVATAHSIAYRSVGKNYEKRLKDRLRVYHVRNMLNLGNDKDGNYMAKVIFDLLIDYCHSSYLKIRDAFDFSSSYPMKQEDVIKSAEKAWDELIRFDSKYPIFPDFYLKVYQLSGESIHKDWILFDEAQDANPAIVDIILKQKDRGVNCVFVGDEHQAIYSFRGADNSLGRIKPEKELYLTESFRFGNNIAHLINCILKVGKGESKDIIGTKKEDSVGGIDIEKPFAVLTRTNSNLFLKASEVAAKNKKMYFVGGYDSYQFFKIKDVECLYNKKKYLIRDPHIKSFNNFNEMMDISEQVDDKELIYYGKTVDKYRGEVSKVIEKIKDNTVFSMAQADVILSTAHKSKGLEFKQVMLTNDYVDIINKDGGLDLLKMKKDEVNILYVAASRAQERLKLNGSLKKIERYYNCNKEHLFVENKKGINYKNMSTKKNLLNRKIESKL